MGFIFTLLSRPIGLVILGLLIMALGSMVLQDSTAPLPKREDLARIEGALERISNPPLKPGARGDSTRYQIELRTSSGAHTAILVPKFVFPEGVIDQLKRGERFVAARAADGTYWDVRVGERYLMDYELRTAQVLANHAAGLFWSVVGIASGGAVSLLGILWWRYEKSGYFSSFIGSFLFLAMCLGFGVYLASSVPAYLHYRQVLADGIETQATITGAEIARKPISNYWLALSWQDRFGSSLRSGAVPVTKTVYEKLAANPVSRRAPLPVKYLIIDGTPVVAVREAAADIEAEWRYYLLFLSAMTAVGSWIFGLQAWRLWRRWRTTPGAGL